MYFDDFRYAMKKIVQYKGDREFMRMDENPSDMDSNDGNEEQRLQAFGGTESQLHKRPFKEDPGKGRMSQKPSISVLSGAAYGGINQSPYYTNNRSNISSVLINQTNLRQLSPHNSYSSLRAHSIENTGIKDEILGPNLKVNSTRNDR